MQLFDKNMALHNQDVITPDDVKSLPSLFQERIKRSAHKTAYRYFNLSENAWCDINWLTMSRRAAQWQSAFLSEGLKAGDRVAIMLPNSIEWVMFDQAAMGLGLIVVPLHNNDSAENAAFILRDSGSELLFIDGPERWDIIEPARDKLGDISRIITVDKIDQEPIDPRICLLSDWLKGEDREYSVMDLEPDQMATIVYTSGTTSRPKGVKLSHQNILWNAWSAFRSVNISIDDTFLSFLPLSHTYERTIGYYLPIMMGAVVAYARSIPLLSEDLLIIKPTVLITVPRIFERIYMKIETQLSQGFFVRRWLFEMAVKLGWNYFQVIQEKRRRNIWVLFWPLFRRLVASHILSRFGGRLRVSVSGGAALSPKIAKVFIGLGVPLLQGYGLTETSPVISVNRLHDNDPESVGIPLNDVTLKLGLDQEILVKSPGVMMGYWNRVEETKKRIDDEGWLHTGDKGEIRERHLYITGRIKEIIVMANGEKASPVSMEMAILLDSLFIQAMVLGDNRPFLSAIVVLDPDQWKKLARKLQLNTKDPLSLLDRKLEHIVAHRIQHLLIRFPEYTKVRRVAMTLDEWTMQNGMLTPTLKIKRD
ncbi:MAG: AMP-dependent synthetase/ligase, partial [Chlamydiota bacterium]|nr:AMP-dependent synthetase/ligase [Chlamydiota bacterium]